MTYTKPEITPLGQASANILGQGKVSNIVADAATAPLPVSQHRMTIPAYEADE